MESSTRVRMGAMKVTEFTPLASFLGGLLIGCAAVVLMLFIGRIAGVSGIVSRILPSAAGGWGWRLAFVLGVVAAPVLAQLATGEPIRQTVSSSLPLMTLAGLLVGFGSVLGGGCTSGHGVCGISRLSIRSLAATATFMVVAIATVFVARHVVGA
jgi:uncharacterized membrane protein YedE/YeeE